MRNRTAFSRVALSVGLFVIGSTLMVAVGNLQLSAQPPFGGKGKGKNDPSMQADMAVFHELLENRKEIKRTVKNIDNGVETITTSENAEVVKKIQEHAAAMHKRVKEGRGIHLRDPLFQEIFKNYSKITMKVEKIEKGVKVVETSDDPYVAKLIQAHAEVVSKFIANGHDEARKNHPLPDRGDKK